jgi:hypothetical protein
MILSNSGKIIHFYFVSGRWIGKTIGVIGLLLALSLTLILTLPEFAMHQPNFVISSDPIFATVQVLVGIIFLGSMVGGTMLGVFVLLWFWPEIICEVILKKRTLIIIQSLKKISLSELAETIGVNEGELSILLEHWVTAWNKFRANPTKGTFSGNHLNIDLANKEISWEE